jgi:histidyl-tRNA synthetase
LTYDHDMLHGLARSAKDGRAREVLIREHISSQLRAVFQTHGAMPLAPPLLFPRAARRAPPGQDSSEAVVNGAKQAGATDLLDADGVVVTLPTDLLLPFARYGGEQGVRRR